MGVHRIDVFAAGVAHNCPPDFDLHTRQHQPAVEAVAEIMESVIADTGAADRCPPSGFDLANRFVVEREYQPTFFPVLPEKIEQFRG